MNVSPLPADAAAPANGKALVDEESPWLGLVSFTEETRDFFFGREQEIAELSRRVQGKLLTVLFGKSGLGKTSILRAGLVPRLRQRGYCPVYVRIDYGRETPEPAEQIKGAIRRAASISGQWTQAGVAAAGETLWEFLHHRDDVLRDASGATLTPLLIFDQFEEIFTLAQSDDFGKARAGRFMEELADLVENRPPKALEARLDKDEDAAQSFDFARSDYRVLIALREDYLAPLESLKKMMPSLSQNRLRLAPMRGAQALEAVLRPGRNLVSDEVAAEIVRFVAGRAELADAEVEPALLSLICRELNDARLRQGRAEISFDLLAGSQASILSNFYERSVADQPAAVRRIIEDELLTESGFRENVAEERLLKRLEAAGGPPATLATLVNRRLLRIEERLDVRRVELIHDVLCGVVKASRDQRHERETREATERVLAEQRTREQAARHALRRARAVATGCILLAVFALAAAVFAYVSGQRARQAERMAQQSRAVAEEARSHSERLLAYLSDDFERELESFGQLQVIAQFTQREIDYFHALPAELRSADTIRDAALALSERAWAVDTLAESDRGLQNSDEAIRLLEGLRRGGDNSEATLVGLGRAYVARCMVHGDLLRSDAADACDRAVAILEPLADRQGASLPVERAYLFALVNVGWIGQWNSARYERSLQATEQAMQLATRLGARDLRDFEISGDYVYAGVFRVEVLVFSGRDDEALRVGNDSLVVADRLLEQRPWYRLALRSRELTDMMMAFAAYDRLDPRTALSLTADSRQPIQAFLRIDPNSWLLMGDLANQMTSVGQWLWAMGRVDEAIDSYPKTLEQLAKAAQGTTSDLSILNAGSWMAAMLDEQVIAGDPTGAARSAASSQRQMERIVGNAPPGSVTSLTAELIPQLVQAEAAYERDDFTGASRYAQAAVAQLTHATPRKDSEKAERAYLLYYFSDIYGRSEYRLGRFAAAESAERIALEQRNFLSNYEGTGISDKRDLAGLSTWLSMMLARQGKRREAAQMISPFVSFEQGLLARDHGDVWVPYELACALYAQSLSEPARGEVLLRRAAALLNRLPPRLQKLRDVRQWRRWVLQPVSTG